MENNNQQQEIIEVAENKKTGIWESVKQKVTGMSNKSIILFSVGALALVTAGFVVAEVYEDKLEVLGDQIERQVGIVDDDDNQQVIAQTNASSASSENTTCC